MKRSNSPDRNQVEPTLPEGLRRDLRRVYEHPVLVPPEVDRRILSEARAHLSEARVDAATSARSVHRLRSAAVAAAGIAAAIVVGVLVWAVLPTASTDQANQALAGDVDRNGRIDILDAFALARTIERGEATSEAWDVNGDGRVDAGDVDLVAERSVRLEAEAG